LTSLPKASLLDILPSQEPLGLEECRPNLGTEGMELLSQLLDVDYRRRLTARQALGHAYFADAGVTTQVAVEGAREASEEAFQTYLARDFRQERSWQMWLLTVLSALGPRLRGKSGLSQHIWSFLAKPTRPQPDYMLAQKEITKVTRATAVAWLVWAINKLGLQPAVLPLSVHLFDGFLPMHPGTRKNEIWLVAAASLFLAAKIEHPAYNSEDLNAKTLNDLTGCKYSENQILETEIQIATSRKFCAPAWGPYHFLCHFCSLAKLSQRYFFVAQALLEQSLCFYELSRFSPSLLAGGCCWLAIWLQKGYDGGRRQGLRGEPLREAQADPSKRSEPPASSQEAAARKAQGVAVRRFRVASGRSPAEVEYCADDIVSSFLWWEDNQHLWWELNQQLKIVRHKFARKEYLDASALIWPPVSVEAAS